MEFLSDYIGRVSYFLILSAFVGIILPDKKFKEYINLVLGLILILILLKPLANVRHLEEAFSFPDLSFPETQTNQAEMQYYIETREQMLFDVYRSRLIDQIGSLVESKTDYKPIDISLEIQPDTGALTHVTMTVSPKEVAPVPSGRPFIRIEEVDLKKSLPVEEDASEKSLPVEENIKNIISDFYNLSVANIHIRVQRKPL